MKELKIFVKTDDVNLVENSEGIMEFAKELEKRGWGYMKNGKIYCDESKESDVLELFDKYIKG